MTTILRLLQVAGIAISWFSSLIGQVEGEANDLVDRSGLFFHTKERVRTKTI